MLKVLIRLFFILGFAFAVDQVHAQESTKVYSAATCLPGGSATLGPGQTCLIMDHIYVAAGSKMTLEQNQYTFYLCTAMPAGGCDIPDQNQLNNTASIWYEIAVSQTNAIDLGYTLFTRYGEVRTPENPNPWNFKNVPMFMEVVGPAWITARMQNGSTPGAPNAVSATIGVGLLWKKTGP